MVGATTSCGFVAAQRSPLLLLLFLHFFLIDCLLGFFDELCILIRHSLVAFISVCNLPTEFWVVCVVYHPLLHVNIFCFSSCTAFLSVGKFSVSFGSLATDVVATSILFLMSLLKLKINWSLCSWMTGGDHTQLIVTTMPNYHISMNLSSEAVDVFTCNWKDDSNLLYPLVFLVPRVIQHAQWRN